MIERMVEQEELILKISLNLVGEECKGIEFELREYKGSERTQMHVDPLQWWHVNEKKFPVCYSVFCLI